MIDLLKPNIYELRDKWMPTVGKTRRIFTWTTDDELCWIAEYATRCTHYLEIGSYVGRSAKVAWLANPNLNYFASVDTWDDEGSLEDYRHNLRMEIKTKNLEIFQGNSQEILLKPPFNGMAPLEVGGHPYRAAFNGCWIDGGHLAHLVEADINNVHPLMCEGCLMAGHDYHGDNDVACGVRAALGSNFHNPVDSIWCSVARHE